LDKLTSKIIDPLTVVHLPSPSIDFKIIQKFKVFDFSKRFNDF